MNEADAIHLVICTHGRPRLLQRTLDSLARMERPANFARLWVVENGSDAGARKLCEKFTALPTAYLRLDQPGKSRALQQAIERIARGLVVFTDDDVRVNREWLTAYAAAARRHGEHAFFGGPLLIDSDVSPPPWLREHLPPSVLGWQRSSADETVGQACFLGANYAASAQRMLAVGGFRAELGVGGDGNPVGEEFDMQERLLAAGCRGVYVPQAQVWHYVPAKRCTPQWALERIERIWLTNGLMDGKVHPGPRLFGAPRWMWRKLPALWLQALLANLGHDPRQRFERKKPFYQHRGYLRGLRRQRRQPITP